MHKIISSTESSHGFNSWMIIGSIMTGLLSLLIYSKLNSETENCPHYSPPLDIPQQLSTLFKISSDSTCNSLTQFIEELPITSQWRHSMDKNQLLTVAATGESIGTTISNRSAYTDIVQKFDNMRQFAARQIPLFPKSGPGVRSIGCESRVNIAKGPIHEHNTFVFVSGAGNILDPVYGINRGHLNIFQCTGDKMYGAISGTFSPREFESIILEPKILSNKSYTDLTFVKTGTTERRIDFWGQDVTNDWYPSNYHTIRFTKISVHSNDTPITELQIISSAEDILDFHSTNPSYTHFDLRNWYQFTSINMLQEQIQQLHLYTNHLFKALSFPLNLKKYL